MRIVFQMFFWGLTLLFAGCNYADMGGMWVVSESANDRFSQSLSYNQTLSPKVLQVNASEYLITVAADAHVGKTENLSHFFEQSKTMNVVAAVLNGDMCNGNDYDYENLKESLPDTADLQYFMIARNHELYFGGWEHYERIFKTSSYYFTVTTTSGSDLFICLDTGSGTLGSKQLKWFISILKDVRPLYRHCVIFTHNNLYRIRKTASTNPTQEELQVLTDLFVRYKVNMVVTGHDHLRNVMEFGNTTHITTDAMYDGFPFASFLKLKIDASGVKYEFVNF